MEQAADDRARQSVALSRRVAAYLVVLPSYLETLLTLSTGDLAALGDEPA